MGTMGKSAERRAGAIYWHFRGETRLLYPGISIPNSICFSPGGAICGATISPRGSFVNATRTISRIAPNPLENRYHIVVPKPFDVAPERHLPSNLTNAPALKAALIDAWPRSVADKIASAQTVKLEGKLAEYVDAFDYSIFQPMSPREVIEQPRHAHFIARFGGGLPPRPIVAAPPSGLADHESVYVARLLAAYADHTKASVPDLATLRAWRPLEDHFKRQRECFYHAEALRVFVRDKVEPGTFEGLQDEIYHGVADTADGDHADGFERVKAVTQAAQDVPLAAHPLGASALVKDKRGICHQLANEDRLKWTK